MNSTLRRDILALSIVLGIAGYAVSPHAELDRTHETVLPDQAEWQARSENLRRLLGLIQAFEASSDTLFGLYRTYLYQVVPLADRCGLGDAMMSNRDTVNDKRSACDQGIAGAHRQLVRLTTRIRATERHYAVIIGLMGKPTGAPGLLPERLAKLAPGTALTLQEIEAAASDLAPALDRIRYHQRELVRFAETQLEPRIERLDLLFEAQALDEAVRRGLKRLD